MHYVDNNTIYHFQAKTVLTCNSTFSKIYIYHFSHFIFAFIGFPFKQENFDRSDNVFYLDIIKVSGM